jgi:ADP-ribose pyrophosphatase YjhB (NUDIX family)
MSDISNPSEPIFKACACMDEPRGRLLVFRHPEDGNMQLPKGTIEAGESPEVAVRRELLEESGIDYAGPLHSLGTLERECEAGVEGNTHRHPQLWHLFLMRANGALPETFEHMATGSPEEEGLMFSFSWLGAGDSTEDFALPYRQTIERVRAALLLAA